MAANPVSLSDVLFHVDEVGSSIRGWAFDASSSHPVVVTVHVDGIALAEVQAEEFRNDLLQLGYREGRCGFRYDMSQAMCDGREHEVMLTSGNPAISMLSAPVRVTLTARAPVPRVEGVFDGVDRNFVASGWVDGAPADAEVVLRHDGKVIAVGHASQMRPDLVLIGRQGRGFNIPLAVESLHEDGELTAECDGVPLTGSVDLDVAEQVEVCATALDDGRVYITLTGWPVERCDLAIFVDGRYRESITVTKESGGGVASLVARWSPPHDLLDARPHVLQVRGHGAIRGASSDPLLMLWPTYRVHIDAMDGGCVSGWAVGAGSVRPLALELRIDGMRPRRVVSGERRPDVASSLGIDNDRVGFSVAFGSDLLGRTVEVFDMATNVLLARASLNDPSAGLASLARAAFSEGSAARAAFAEARRHLRGTPVLDASYLPMDTLPVDRSEVCVVVPVYSGAVETAECLESVLAHSGKQPFHLILVNDFSPDEAITAYLRRLSERFPERITLVERKTNGGFSEAVNLGMAIAGRRDVILLNADTVVHGDWVDRILAIAEADPTVATITPFSSNGEICSLPYLCKSLPVKEHRQLALLDGSAARSSIAPVELPVAVGYCMYIRRECLDEIGPFDAATWGRGYGEEVDFCLKASARGWRHVLAPNVFVVHRGGVSFGDEKIVRIQESSKKIAERYPFYDGMIQTFLRADAPAPARRAINVEVLANELPSCRVLHVTHAFGGGTQRYVDDMARLYRDAGCVDVQLAFDADGNATLAIDTRGSGMDGLFAVEHREHYSAEEHGLLLSHLGLFGFEKIHLHAPFGMRREILDWVVEHQVFDATIHDYAWICPRVTLSTPLAGYCGQPVLDACRRCTMRHGVHPGLDSMFLELGADVGRYRDYFAAVLEKAHCVYVGGKDVAARMQAAGVRANYQVRPHPGFESGQRSRVRNTASAGGAIRVALIGGISRIKGSSVLAECAREAHARRLPIEFVIFGTTADGVCDQPNVHVLGSYEEEELPSLLEAHAPDLAFFPNQWPETFSYTLSEAMASGIWPVVTDIGVPAERVRESGFGDVIPLSATVEQILGLIGLAAEKARAYGSVKPKALGAATLHEYQNVTS